MLWAVSVVVTHSVFELALISVLTVPALRQSGGSILGNEARQNSKLREGLGLNFFNGKLLPCFSARLD